MPARINIKDLPEEMQAKFLQYMKVDSLDQILAKHYDKAVSALESKRAPL